jgi:ADP-ribosylglycohydrolase
MQREYLYDHVLGGLYGQALGDAFGMPAMLRPSVTRERFGWISGFLDAPEDHPAHHGLKSGQITDDTEQAMSLAQVIIRDKGISVEGAADAIVGWYDAVDGDHNDYIGPNTRKAVAKLKNGANPYITGKQSDTNGGAMRISPVGLINPGNIEQSVKDTAAACIPTHNTDVAIAGASAIAGAISMAMMPGVGLDVIINAGCQAAEKGLALGEHWFGASIPRRIRFAITLAKQDKDVVERMQDIYDLIGCGLLTSEAVPSAFGIVVLSQGDIMNCARFAANLSGDADTVGAMACAIVGAWKGYSSFPSEVINKLDESNPDWDFKQVAKGLTNIGLDRVNS